MAKRDYFDSSPRGRIGSERTTMSGAKRKLAVHMPAPEHQSSSLPKDCPRNACTRLSRLALTAEASVVRRSLCIGVSARIQDCAQGSLPVQQQASIHAKMRGALVCLRASRTAHRGRLQRNNRLRFVSQRCVVHHNSLDGL